MRTPKPSGLVLLPLLAGLAACSTSTTVQPAAGAGATPAPATTTTTTTTTTTNDTSGAVTSTTAVTTPAVSASGPNTLPFAAMNNSGFAGTVTLTNTGTKTRVTLLLNAPANTDADKDHNAHILTGTCAAPGPVVAGLHDVEGNGKPSDTEVDLTAAQLMDGQHVIQVNENPGDRAVACVAIPAVK
jgi:hypothetical protein